MRDGDRNGKLMAMEVLRFQPGMTALLVFGAVAGGAAASSYSLIADVPAPADVSRDDGVDADAVADADSDGYDDTAVCDVPCVGLPHVAEARCEVDACVIVGCDAHWWDVNGIPGDGCEYGCTISSGAHEVCDDVDNDCDGARDEDCGSLVLYLSMDGAGSSVLDGSGHGHDGTMAGDVSWVDDGVWGRALNFGGSGYVEIPHAADLSGLALGTWMVWIEAYEVPPAARTPMSKDGDYRFIDEPTGGGDYRFYWATPEYPWPVGVRSLVPVTLGRWHLLAATYDGSQVTIYIDGLPANHESTSGPVGSRTYPLAVGAEYTPVEHGYHYFFVGKIDEVAIYNRAWSDAEVARYYRSLVPSGG